MVTIVKPKSYTAADIYKFFKQNNPKSKVPYWMFKEVLTRFNKKASDTIIMGGMLNLGNNLGYVRIKKIRRNYEKAEPNWKESNVQRRLLLSEGKLPKGPDHPDGENWIVFFTDPWYLRWAWIKKGVCRVKNQSVYEFKPTSDQSRGSGDVVPEVSRDRNKLGNKGKLVLANRLNPALHHVYEN